MMNIKLEQKHPIIVIKRRRKKYVFATSTKATARQQKTNGIKLEVTNIINLCAKDICVYGSICFNEDVSQ